MQILDLFKFLRIGAKVKVVLTDADSNGGEENAVVNMKMAITFQSSFNYFPGFVFSRQAAIELLECEGNMCCCDCCYKKCFCFEKYAKGDS